MTTHHLICDDWSTGILLQKIFAYYDDRLHGRSVIESDLDFQYTDYVCWQKKLFEGKVLQSRLEFWKKQLSASGSFHHLLLDRARPASRTYRGHVQRRTLRDDLKKALVQLSRSERVSLFMVMLAALQCLLHRHSGDSEIAIGSCAANRKLTQTEGLIGRFANDLVIRTDLSGNPSFSELLARARNDALTAYSYADVPFATVVQEVEPNADPRRNPLFQVMLILQDAPKALDCRIWMCARRHSTLERLSTTCAYFSGCEAGSN